MRKSTNIVWLAVSALVCLMVLASAGVDTKEVEESKVKAIKERLEEIKHLITKREAEKKTSTTKKPAKKSSADSTSTKSPKKHSGKSLKPDINDDNVDASSTSTEKPSLGSSKNPRDLIEEAVAEAKRERAFWNDVEEEALDYMLAGVDSLIKSYDALGKNIHARTKLGEVLDKYQRFVDNELGQAKVQNLISGFRDLRDSRRDGGHLDPLPLAAMSKTIIGGLRSFMRPGGSEI